MDPNANQQIAAPQGRTTPPSAACAPPAANAPHRLENIGTIPVLLIKVQNGEYLDEGNIIRFTDDFGRGKL